jgi:protein-arginine kinase activator protein McsA
MRQATCPQCGKRFTPGARGGRFCCVLCHNRAHSALTYAVKAAIKRGELIRPMLCEGCGQQRSVDAHHDDYSKPLSVRWLCRACHQEHHNAVKIALRMASGLPPPAGWMEL